MVVIRLANLLVLIFRENDPKIRPFQCRGPIVFREFVFLEHIHRVQRKKLLKKLFLKTFRLIFWYFLYIRLYSKTRSEKTT